MSGKIDIIGGYSTHRGITIMSGLFSGKARVTNNHEIEAWSEKLPCIIRWIREKRFWYLPRVIRLIVFLLCAINRRVLYGFLCSSVIAVLLIYIIGPVKIPMEKIELSTKFAPFIFPFLIFLNTFIFVAPWHGAEHKTISAYINHESVKLMVIRKESRVTELCGSRLLLPLLVAMSTPLFIKGAAGLAVSITLLEVILWVDELWNWNKIPIVSQMSFFIQRYFLTREPGDLEIYTAQAAIRELLDAHRRISNQ